MKTATDNKKTLLTSKQKPEKANKSLETSSIKNKLKTAITAEELKKRTTEFLTALDWKK